MANEINISAVTGLAISLQLYSGATPVGAAFSATEIDTTGEYIADFPASIPYGIYLVIATVGGSYKIASGNIYWTGQYEMIDGISKLEGLDKLNPMSVTPSLKHSGDINIAITGDGETISTLTAL